MLSDYSVPTNDDLKRFERLYRYNRFRDSGLEPDDAANAADLTGHGKGFYDGNADTE